MPAQAGYVTTVLVGANVYMQHVIGVLRKKTTYSDLKNAGNAFTLHYMHANELITVTALTERKSQV